MSPPYFYRQSEYRKIFHLWTSSQNLEYTINSSLLVVIFRQKLLLKRNHILFSRFVSPVSKSKTTISSNFPLEFVTSNKTITKNKVGTKKLQLRTPSLLSQQKVSFVLQKHKKLYNNYVIVFTHIILTRRKCKNCLNNNYHPRFP